MGRAGQGVDGRGGGGGDGALDRFPRKQCHILGVLVQGCCPVRSTPDCGTGSAARREGGGSEALTAPCPFCAAADTGMRCGASGGAGDGSAPLQRCIPRISAIVACGSHFYSQHPHKTRLKTVEDQRKMTTIGAGDLRILRIIISMSPGRDEGGRAPFRNPASASSRNLPPPVQGSGAAMEGGIPNIGNAGWAMT